MKCFASATSNNFAFPKLSVEFFSCLLKIISLHLSSFSLGPLSFNHCINILASRFNLLITSVSLLQQTKGVLSSA